MFHRAFDLLGGQTRMISHNLLENLLAPQRISSIEMTVVKRSPSAKPEQYAGALQIHGRSP
jgi:hypothetical protein